MLVSTCVFTSARLAPACLPACPQCAKLHLLDSFDGEKRSCRASLEQHKQRRQAKQAPGRRQEAAAEAAAAAQGQGKEEALVGRQGAPQRQRSSRLQRLLEAEGENEEEQGATI